MKLKDASDDSGSFPTILLQKSTKPLILPLMPQNRNHLFSKNLRSKHDEIYSVDASRRKLRARIADLWQTSRQNQKLCKKDFIKQNMQIVTNLNRLNQIKELDPFSRKVLFDNYLKTFTRVGLCQKQKKILFAKSMQAQGKTEQSDQFLTSCPTSKLWPKRHLHRKNCEKEYSAHSKKHQNHRKARAAPIKAASKSKTKSYVIRSKISTKHKEEAMAKTCRSMGQTPRNLFKRDFSRIHVKLKPIQIESDEALAGLERKQKFSQENEFESLVERSFQKAEKKRSIEQLENVVNGQSEAGFETHVVDSSNPVTLNCDLKKILHSYQDRLKALKTKSNYVDKHKAKLGKLLERCVLV